MTQNEAIRGFVDRVVVLYDTEAEIGSSAMLQQYGFSAKDIDNALRSAFDLATGWSRLLKRNDAQYFYDDVAETSER